MNRRLIIMAAAVAASLVAVQAHEHSLHSFLSALQASRAQQADQAEKAPASAQAACRLSLDLRDAGSGKALPGLVRVKNLQTGKFVQLAEGIEREQHWYAVPAGSVLTLPRERVSLEAMHGLETEKVVRELNLGNQASQHARFELKRFYDAGQAGLRSGNTHLHLNNLSRAQAEEYLEVVSRADDLDLLFVSHLRRIPEEVTYITNTFTGADLKALSKPDAVLGYGQEHRHNFGPGGEGYGHVMLLNIRRLIQPVSIGPGIMKEGTDGIPLQRGIRQARSDGASVIWCHNTLGFEDIPNWASGLIHAQNIFDGGPHGSYKDTFYRYLNTGMKVPFSTGTDWFVYDFSRVYVPMSGETTVEGWLAALSAGRSFITNGPLLRFEVQGKTWGDTVQLSAPGNLKVAAHAAGRNDFSGLELIWNGKVVHSVRSGPSQGHFQADLAHSLPVNEPGWLAVRVPLEAGKNDFGRTIYAHTSAVYVTLGGESIFVPETVRELIEEVKQGRAAILEKATFGGTAERNAVIGVYDEGIRLLEEKLRSRSSGGRE